MNTPEKYICNPKGTLKEGVALRFADNFGAASLNSAAQIAQLFRRFK